MCTMCIYVHRCWERCVEWVRRWLVMVYAKVYEWTVLFRAQIGSWQGSGDGNGGVSGRWNETMKTGVSPFFRNRTSVSAASEWRSKDSAQTLKPRGPAITQTANNSQPNNNYRQIICHMCTSRSSAGTQKYCSYVIRLCSCIVDAVKYVLQLSGGLNRWLF